MEQDRTPSVLPYHSELAGQTADQPHGGGRIDRATTTKTGLTVRCELDTRSYPKGLKVSDAEMAGLNIKGATFHPEWNYTISPSPPN
jgi:hypothetical protein